MRSRLGSRGNSRWSVSALPAGAILLIVVVGVAFMAARAGGAATPAGHPGSVSVAASTPPVTPIPAATTAVPDEKLATATAGTTPTPNARLPLLGRRIGLDPGHGPRGDLGAVLLDPGTGKIAMTEAEITLDIGLRCRDILLARGASVVLTRETAETFTGPWPIDANGDGNVAGLLDDMQERVDVLNDFNSEAYVSIHVNNAPKQRDLHGVQVYSCSSPDCVAPAESERLGQLVLDQMKEKITAAGFPMKRAELHSDLWLDGTHFYLLGPASPPSHPRATKMPGVIAESLYLTSPADAEQLKREEIRQATALAYADALQEFLLGGNQP